MKVKSNIIADCPSCGERVVLDKSPRLGDFVVCRICEEKLEVIDLNPILLDFPLEDESYDYEYEDDYDSDDDGW